MLLYEAEIVTEVEARTAEVLTVNVALVAPAGTVTLEGTLAARCYSKAPLARHPWKLLRLTLLCPWRSSRLQHSPDSAKTKKERRMQEQKIGVCPAGNCDHYRLWRSCCAPPGSCASDMTFSFYGTDS